MRSERVPSLFDGEWYDGNDSAQEFHSSKFRPYDAAYSRERSAPHQPQKKHHMFRKRCFQSTIPRFTYANPACKRVRHDHTYSVPIAAADTRKAAVRNKRVRRLIDGSMSDGGSSATSTGQHLSKDEKRAKTLGIPLEVHDVINLPMNEFNERLRLLKHNLSEAQLSLIRDIRRRGKNKVAALNCRKRNLDQITLLDDEVRTVRDRKQRTQRDHSSLLAERQRVKERFAALYRHVFQNLLDPEGRPVSSQHYSFQQAADGNVVLVPKMSQHQDHQMNRTSDEDMDRKAKHCDQ